MKLQLSTAALAVFLVVDVALVGVALQSSHDASDAATTLPDIASASDTSTPSPTAIDATSPYPSSTPTSTPMTTPSTPAPAYRPAPLTVMIVGEDGSRAWRAAAGQCQGGGGAIQTTSNGGAAWAKVASSGRAITRIQPLAGPTGFADTAGADCVLREFTTNDEGRSWQGPRPVDGGWARQLGDPKMVVTPKRLNSRACGEKEVLDLARVSSTQAQVLCLDGGVKRTVDGGTSWSQAGQAPGGLSLATRVLGRSMLTYLARVSATCPGIEIVQVLAPGTDPKRVSCLNSPGRAAPGAVSLSTPSGAGWLAVGDETWVAGADLRQWKKV